MIFTRKKLTALLLLVFSVPLLHAEKIVFEADSMSGTAGSKTDTTTLTGNASVVTNSMQIKADSIELSGEDFRFITATGTVSGSITESQMDFSCGKLKYDRETKIAQLEDSVHMTDKANDVTADAQIIEYSQTTNIAVMQIEITLKQKNNVCTAAYAIYKKDGQTLEMSGNPKIVQGADTFRAQEIMLNLEMQEITLDGRVKGTVTDSKKEETKTETGETPADEKEISEPGENTPPPAEDMSNRKLEPPAKEEKTSDE